MKVTTKELTPEDVARAEEIRRKFEARRAAAPPSPPVSEAFVRKMTSGIADPDAADAQSPDAGK